MTTNAYPPSYPPTKQIDQAQNGRPQILLVGNHTCGNRGDAAIIRGLVTQLKVELPTAEVTITSRYPVSSAFLLDRGVLPDVTDRWFAGVRSRLPPGLRNWQRRVLVPIVLGLATRPSLHWLRRLLPRPLRCQIAWLKRFDIIVQVGGSFFVDLYGYRQFETPFVALLAGRPLLLIGHSMGPFGSWLYRVLATQLLRGATHVSLRESLSSRLLIEAGLPAENVSGGSDTAWLVDSSRDESARRLPPIIRRPAVAITLRDLAPFDRRLGISQTRYEAGFAALADYLIREGYDVVACSTCTGIDSYHRDDRMSALRVRGLVEHPSFFHVIMDELNDVELGSLLGECELLIGTRLHSAIIAMNFGTPAISLNYEHKSAGILGELGLPEMSLPVDSLFDGTLLKRVRLALDNLSELKGRVAIAVARERIKARRMVQLALALTQGEKPL